MLTGYDFEEGLPGRSHSSIGNTDASEQVMESDVVDPAMYCRACGYNAFCHQCGYMLRGLGCGVCPECGRVFDFGDLRSVTFHPKWDRLKRIGKFALFPLILLLLVHVWFSWRYHREEAIISDIRRFASVEYSDYPPSIPKWIYHYFYSPLESTNGLTIFNRHVLDLTGLQHIVHLQRFIGRKSDVSDDDLRYCRSLSELRVLNLDETSVTDKGIKNLRGLQSLVSLSLKDTRVTDQGLTYLRNLKTLGNLELDGTNISDDGLRSLANMKSLELLRLSDTRINGTGIAHLRGISTLWSLRLDNTLVDDDAMRHVSTFNLRDLSLDNTGISDEGLEYIADLDELRTLSLGDTQVSLEGLLKLQDLKYLHYLSLRNTRLSKQDIVELRLILPSECVVYSPSESFVYSDPGHASQVAPPKHISPTHEFP